MDQVYLLHHMHRVSEDHEDIKLLGVFSTRELAERAKERALNLPGFKDSPDGFSVDKYIIDRMGWTAGYRTV
ncbi:DUF7336 domain-containing protein [Asticcacaulis taihuensis]|uniref:DUF7336 domain-containing protein n=1 Tax=Asticcacaulis taihuensis TaxID=260084 RepID=A0A1G4S2Z6_9CAUL|nr:hypothetical protein [Asticcacaulis taihuensis]SCW63603.1 hypothetical protein SAMN02927928_2387 [Asticcacaulis taihuensis]